MISSTIEDSRRYDPLQDPRLGPRSYGGSYSQEQLWDRLSQPSVLISLFVILGTILYHIAHSQAASRGRQLPTFGEVVWNTIVFVTPAFFLYAVDRWVNPPLFPRPMLSPQPATHSAKSDVLRRILRTDQAGGIVASVSQAGRRAYTNTFAGFKGDSGQPAGLRNWDYSCFQNSILQGLASLKRLPRYLNVATPATPVSNDESSTTADALNAFIADLNDASNNGKTLSTPSVLKNMSTIQQQDAQEYFSRLMDQVDKDVERAAKATCRPPGFEADIGRDDTVTSQHSDDSGYQSLPMLSKAGSDLMAIRNPLEGLSAQRVACTSCGYSEGLSMIPFNCLTLNLEVGVSHYDLFQLLDSYVTLESIENVDCVKCTLIEYREKVQQMAKVIPAAADRLEAVERILEEDEFDEKSIQKLKIPDSTKVSSTKTKQVVIGRPPSSLVIHMNRSVFNPITFQSYKNMAAVQFPMTLDLGPWCIGSAEGVSIPTRTKPDGEGVRRTDDAADQEQWVLDPTASMVAGDTQPSKISGPIYELRAVVTHYGRHENGHYVCYRKHPRTTAKVSGSYGAKGDTVQPPSLKADEPTDDVDDVDSINGDHLVEETTAAADGDALYSEETGSQWWRLSDETVYKVSEEDVLSQEGVFMLFYDCVDPNSVLISHTETAAADDCSGTPLTSIEERGCKSPSWSEASAATWCNLPAEHGDTSRVASVTDLRASPVKERAKHHSETISATTSRASSVTLTAPEDDASSPTLVGRLEKSALGDSLAQLENISV